MVVFDSEYICVRCKRRIKKGHEVWIHDFPYGPVCASIIRSKDKQLPERPVPGVQIVVDFERFRTAGVSTFREKE